MHMSKGCAVDGMERTCACFRKRMVVCPGRFGEPPMPHGEGMSMLLGRMVAVMEKSMIPTNHDMALLQGENEGHIGETRDAD